LSSSKKYLFCYSHREGEEGGKLNQREGEDGGKLNQREGERGKNTNVTDPYLQSRNSDKHLPQSPFTGQFFR
jgi:hypothetical protein